MSLPLGSTQYQKKVSQGDCVSKIARCRQRGGLPGLFLRCYTVALGESGGTDLVHQELKRQASERKKTMSLGGCPQKGLGGLKQVEGLRWIRFHCKH